MIALLLTAQVAVAQPVLHLPPLVAASVGAQLLERLNAHRRLAGLRLLRIDVIAVQAAQQQADDMATTGNLVHGDKYGRQPMTRYEVLGGNPAYYGENVGFYGSRSLDQLDVSREISSLDELMMAELPPNDGHRLNILSEHFQAVGFGFAIGPRGFFFDEDFVGYRR